MLKTDDRFAKRKFGQAPSKPTRVGVPVVITYHLNVNAKKVEGRGGLNSTRLSVVFP